MAVRALGGELKADRVEAIAIGNEPNFYDTAANYAEQAKTLEKEIIANLSLSADKRRVFEVIDAASKSPPSWL